jgi:hypothetical protein
VENIGAICEWDLELPGIAPFAGRSVTLPEGAVASVTYGGHTYALLEEGLGWDAAEESCESFGGHLATITSREEQEAVNGLLDYGTRNSYWIGGEREPSGNWSWVTGEDFSYSNWCDPVAVESSIVVYREDDALKKGYGKGVWNDLDRGGILPGEKFFGVENIGAICEWDTI